MNRNVDSNNANLNVDSNNANFHDMLTTIKALKPRINKKDSQLLYAPQIHMYPLGNNKKWVVSHNHRIPRGPAGTRVRGSTLSKENKKSITIQPNSRRTKAGISNRPAGRPITNEEAALIRELHKSKKKGWMTLYHSSTSPLQNVGASNIIVSPNRTYFHTNPKWTYHGSGRKTEYQLHIPVNVVKNEALQSMAFFEYVNNEKGHSTLILPAMMSKVLNVNNRTNVRIVQSVYKKLR